MGLICTELMLLGFMSLLLAVTQERISKICVPSGAGNIMLPCRKQTNSEPENLVAIKHFTKVMIWNLSSMNDLWGPYRRLEEEDNDVPPSPPEAAATDSCPNVCFLIEYCYRYNNFHSYKERKRKKSTICLFTVLTIRMGFNLQGKVALMSQDGIHQLHIFIFVLAAMQIVYTILTLALGRAKVKSLLNLYFSLVNLIYGYFSC